MGGYFTWVGAELCELGQYGSEERGYEHLEHEPWPPLVPVNFSKELYFREGILIVEPGARWFSNVLCLRSTWRDY